MNDLYLWLAPFTLLLIVGLLILSVTGRYTAVRHDLRHYSASTFNQKHIVLESRRVKHIKTALVSLYLSILVAAATIFLAMLANFFTSLDNACHCILELGTCLASLTLIYSVIAMIKESGLSLEILYRLIHKNDFYD